MSLAAGPPPGALGHAQRGADHGRGERLFRGRSRPQPRSARQLSDGGDALWVLRPRFRRSSCRGARSRTEFDPGDGCFHLVYAGALLPKAHGVLERFLQGVACLRALRQPSGAPAAAAFHRHRHVAERPDRAQRAPSLPSASGVAEAVTEHPHRMAYLDVLANLVRAGGVLIVGSTEPHYTPSKVYQAVQSRRPVLALLHEASAAVEVLRKKPGWRRDHAYRAGASRAGPHRRLLSRRFSGASYDPSGVDWNAFEAYSARESARRMAAALDEALARFRLRTRSREMDLPCGSPS